MLQLKIGPTDDDMVELSSDGDRLWAVIHSESFYDESFDDLRGRPRSSRDVINRLRDGQVIKFELTEV